MVRTSQYRVWCVTPTVEVRSADSLCIFSLWLLKECCEIHILGLLFAFLLVDDAAAEEVVCAWKGEE